MNSLTIFDWNQPFLNTLITSLFIIYITLIGTYNNTQKLNIKLFMIMIRIAKSITIAHGIHDVFMKNWMIPYFIFPFYFLFLNGRIIIQHH